MVLLRGALLVLEMYLHGFINGEVLHTEYTDLKDRVGPVYLM